MQRQNELELWRFVTEHLADGAPVVLLVVAESSGSSPGRAGFKMAVAEDGLCGSIGGGVMEVRLVEVSRENLDGDSEWEISREVHRKEAESPSGMICSGEQTVIRIRLGPNDLATANRIRNALSEGETIVLSLTEDGIAAAAGTAGSQIPMFSSGEDEGFEYKELVGKSDRLFIVGGGHCALALSWVMSRLGFHITVFDDRADLNTLERNEFADEITVLTSYELVTDLIPSGDDVFVAVMTIGYQFDDLVIRRLLGREFRYFGVLGSRAKMTKLLRDLRRDGFSEDDVSKIRTPAGLPIQSRTPEEIAVSIAAEIIAVRNAKY